MGLVRFTIDVEGQPRTLFSVIEKQSNTTLVLKSAEFNARHGDAVYADNHKDDPSRIIENRFSIHLSPNSRNINAIKHTMILESGKRIYNRNYTQVIKKKERFTLIFCRQCGNISGQNYLAKGNFANVSLGHFEPKFFTLMYGAYVGSRDVEFATTNKHRIINVVQRQFKDQRIVVLWTFLSWPSPARWRTHFICTVPPEKLEPGTTDYGLGQTPDDCVGFFGQNINGFKDQILKDIAQSDYPSEIKDFSRHVASFFKEGLFDSPEFEMYRFYKNL